MATSVPLMPFLRPLGLPRSSTVRQFLRFSTTTRVAASQQQQHQQHQSEDPNLVASRTASPAYPPTSLRSLPRPKESRASQRTNYPRKERPYPTRGSSHNQVVQAPLYPKSVTVLAPHLCAPNLPYYVNRTSNHELPVYNLRKRAGGSLLLTQVKKIDGSLEILRDELRQALGLAEAEAKINRNTNHIELKGHHKAKIQQFLWERMF